MSDRLKVFIEESPSNEASNHLLRAVLAQAIRIERGMHRDNITNELIRERLERQERG